MILVSDVVPFRPPRRPRDVTAYIGMVIFLGGWAMMFAGLFFAYAIVRFKAMSWPPPGEARLPVALPALNTVVILASSGTLALALRAIRAARPTLFKLSVVATFVLGAAFVALQYVVWRRLYLDGLKPDTGIYGSVFYGLTCFHAVHVLVGLIGLLTLVPRAFAGKFSALDHTPVRMWSMYWHFVDFVWLLMFVSVYVL
jgi:cytochrome c oxidase subunit III